MNYNVIIQTEAIIEIQEAFEWYEKVKEGLGFQLAQEIEVCYNKISNNPKYYGFISEKYRCIKTKRFPYLVVFEVSDDSVFIYNLLHFKQDRKY